MTPNKYSSWSSAQRLLNNKTLIIKELFFNLFQESIELPKSGGKWEKKTKILAQKGDRFRVKNANLIAEQHNIADNRANNDLISSDEMEFQYM